MYLWATDVPKTLDTFRNECESAGNHRALDRVSKLRADLWVCVISLLDILVEAEIV